MESDARSTGVQLKSVNLKWFHFDHVLTTSFDFLGRSEVSMVFLWCNATLKLHGAGSGLRLNDGFDLSRVVRKPVFRICENKDADQLRGNREADQRLCFRYIDSTIPLLPKSEISSL